MIPSHCVIYMSFPRVSKADDAFYGSVTVGERGQIVIPAEARTELDIHAGDKLLVMRHPVYKGLMVCKFTDFQKILDEITELIASMDPDKNPAEEEL